MLPVYLVDASIYIFRAWFSRPDTLLNDDGHPVNALHGFFDFTIRFLNEVRPQHIAFVFDENLEHSHRNRIYPDYKKNREPAPVELKRQIAYCRKFIRILGIFEIAHNHYEADDVIGTLAAHAKARGQRVFIVSSDKDLAQLVCDDDVWWDYAKQRSLSLQGIKEYFKVLPEQIPDWLALSGDSVDNIPGIPGIGRVTAAKLLDHFGTLGNLLSNLDRITAVKGLRGAGRIAGLISEYSETLRLARRLTKIVCNVPLAGAADTTLRLPDRRGFEALSVTAGWRQYHKRRFEQYVENLQV